MRLFLIALLILFLYAGCSYKPVNLEKKELSVCIEKVEINSPEPILLDVLNRYITDTVVARGYKLDCSVKRNADIYINVKSFNFYPIGYSPSQRERVYKVSIAVNVKLENKEGMEILNKDIVETTQYIGAGLRANIERRYAIEELIRLLQLRIFSLLTEI